MELGMVRFLPSVKPGRFKPVFQAGARLGDRLAIEFNRPKQNETPIAELRRLTETPEAEPPQDKASGTTQATETMSFEQDQDEREDEEIRKAFAEKDAQIEELQARIAALESVCRRLIEIDDGVYELPDLAIKVLARSCREMLETRRK
jgi:hypothetical protein